MKLKKQLVALVIAIVAVAGCGTDKKSANEANFKASVQAYLDVKFPRCPVLVNFPYEHTIFKGSRIPFMESLTESGLVTKKMIPNPKKGEILGGGDTVPLYELTDLGKKFYVANASNLAHDNSLKLLVVASRIN